MSFYNIYLGLCNSVEKSPSKVAEDIGSTRAAANRWKNGSIPSDSTFLKLANYFGVSVEYLKGEEEQATKKPLPENEERLMEIYELTDGMTESEFIALRAFVAGLKANRKPE